MWFFEWFYKCLIVQGICVFLIISAVIFTRFFVKDLYQDLKELYREFWLSDTSISEVLEDEL
jgi:hypothetical protein